MFSTTGLPIIVHLPLSRSNPFSFSITLYCRGGLTDTNFSLFNKYSDVSLLLRVCDDLPSYLTMLNFWRNFDWIIHKGIIFVLVDMWFCVHVLISTVVISIIMVWYLLGLQVGVILPTKSIRQVRYSYDLID